MFSVLGWLLASFAEIRAIRRCAGHTWIHHPDGGWRCQSCPATKDVPHPTADVSGWGQ